jgi:hypothetical protein
MRAKPEAFPLRRLNGLVPSYYSCRASPIAVYSPLDGRQKAAH